MINNFFLFCKTQMMVANKHPQHKVVVSKRDTFQNATQTPFMLVASYSIASFLFRGYFTGQPAITVVKKGMIRSSHPFSALRKQQIIVLFQDAARGEYWERGQINDNNRTKTLIRSTQTCSAFFSSCVNDGSTSRRSHFAQKSKLSRTF